MLKGGPHYEWALGTNHGFSTGDSISFVSVLYAIQSLKWESCRRREV